MSGYKPFILILILLAALLAACSPMGAEPGAVEPVATEAPPAVEDNAGETPEPDNADATTAAAIAYLANELGLTEAEIELLSAEATEFTDSCLGLGQANESCLQAITPGWLVMLNAGGQEYEVRTDETGEQVRVAGEMGNAPDAAAVAHLAGVLGVAEADIEVVSIEQTEFTDSCLGLGQPDESCLQAITPGWLVILSADGQEYEVHTDETAQHVRVK